MKEKQISARCRITENRNFSPPKSFWWRTHFSTGRPSCATPKIDSVFRGFDIGEQELWWFQPWRNERTMCTRPSWPNKPKDTTVSPLRIDEIKKLGHNVITVYLSKIREKIGILDWVGFEYDCRVCSVVHLFLEIEKGIPRCFYSAFAGSSLHADQ